jgi:hypothetical protein
LLVDGSHIFAVNTGSVDGMGLGVDLRITADAVMTNGGFLTTDALGAGRAGDLRLTAGSVHIDNSFIGSGPNPLDPLGTTGSIEMPAGRVMLTRGALISSSTIGPSRGGDVTVVATDAMSISGSGRSTGLFSITLGAGRAGDIEVKAGRLSLTGGH